MTALVAQIRAEVSMTLRRGETLLLTIGIPLLLLVFFSKIKIDNSETLHPVNVVTPGILALAIMSTSMVSLGIATGFERGYGVLKRMGATPLGRTRLLAAKIVAVFVIEILQAIVIIAVGFALGWKPAGGVIGGITAAAASMAGRLRAEVNLAAANGLYLLLLLLGGMVVPLAALPSGIRTISELLPAAALSSSVRDALSTTASYHGSWVVLIIWGVITPIVAATTFRFQGD